MKTLWKRPVVALALAGLGLCPLVSARAAVETYDIDPVHTWVGFTVLHFFTNVPGYFSKVKGAIVVDRDQLTNSSVEVTIEVPSITTNTKMRDDDLRSDNFFAATKYPAMTFKSRKWEQAENKGYAVTGDLTIKGVTKEVALKVISTGFGPGMKGAAISGWEVSTTLDRRDFGITADQGMIGNNVEIVIHVEADLRK
jgi:polyisoprenoid-binding protein YceI